MEAIEVAAYAKRIVISAEDRRELERLVRSRTAQRRAVERARIVLAAAEGRSAARIAAEVGCSERTVWKWRCRFEADGLAGLMDAPRPGRPLVHGPQTPARLIALACTRPSPTPEGLRRERWTHRELAEAVGMSESQAHEILRAAEIKPYLLEQWVMSDLGPDFDVQAAEVCGLYLDPPEGTLVVSIDEKTAFRRKRRRVRTCRRGRASRAGASTNTAATALRTCSPPCGCTPAR
jgi:transposase